MRARVRACVDTYTHSDKTEPDKHTDETGTLGDRDRDGQTETGRQTRTRAVRRSVRTGRSFERLV